MTLAIEKSHCARTNYMLAHHKQSAHKLTVSRRDRGSIKRRLARPRPLETEIITTINEVALVRYLLALFRDDQCGSGGNPRSRSVGGIGGIAPAGPNSVTVIACMIESIQMLS